MHLLMIIIYRKGVFQLEKEKIKISKGEIQLKVDATNWEEAIQVAAEPLLSEKKIRQGYVDEMINSVKELGPYIVIAPGLALGHARPSEDVKKTSFAIATLDEPVKFGNKDNDPVDIVVILASKTGTDHLELLQKLVKFLGEETQLQLLRQARTVEQANHISDLINEG